jgi:hypothetical protein
MAEYLFTRMSPELLHNVGTAGKKLLQLNCVNCLLTTSTQTIDEPGVGQN